MIAANEAAYFAAKMSTAEREVGRASRAESPSEPTTHPGPASGRWMAGAERMRTVYVEST